MKLAIVGSQIVIDPVDVAEVRSIIGTEIGRLTEADVVISGGAEGVDSIAIDLAKMMGLSVQEYIPKNKRWAPQGYKERNARIASECSELVCIRHKDSRTFGSGWTANLAESLGKPVRRYQVG